MEPKWLDAPFFTLIEDFSSIQGYFMAQAMFIAKIILTLNLGFMALKYMARGEGITEQLIKTLTSVILFLIVVNCYPMMIQGLGKIIYEWSYGSTYGKVAEMIQKSTTSGEASEFWQKKLEQDSDAYSDIIKVLHDKTGADGSNAGTKYVLDIFDKGTETRPGMFIRPNAVIRLLMLIFEQIWNKAVKCVSGSPIAGKGWDIAGFIILTLTAFAVLLGGIFCSLQYFIGAIEFTLIASVGCLLLPFMLWDSTKFLTEKLIGAIIGQATKLLFVTLCFMLTINGFLALMIRPFDSYIDQMIYTLFTIFMYWMLCQNGPALATALLTGTPQLSMAEGLRTAGTMAATALAGGAAVKAAGSVAAKTATRGKAAYDQAKGAGGAAAADSKQAGQSGSAQRGAAAKAAMQSLGDSAKDTVKSGVQGLARSLTNGKSGSSGGGNRFSSIEARNTPHGATNKDGTPNEKAGLRKTHGEFAQENQAKGVERYQQHKAEKKASEQAVWKASLSGNRPTPQQGPKTYDGGTPLGQQSPQRNPTPPSGGNNGKPS